MKVYPYNMGSASARALSRTLGVLRVRENSRTFRPRSNTIINWGNPRLPVWFGRCANATWLNQPLHVQTCSNKLSFLNLLKEAGLQQYIPKFTTDLDEAVEWEYPFIARTHLNGSGGLGAYYVRSPELLADMGIENARLYTKYIKKASEYRVHFARGHIFHVQQKRKRLADDNADFKIRNHDNGWVFTIQDVAAPQAVTHACEQVIAALPLDFGALDVVYNEHYNRAYVLEVNTACGLEGTTLNKYVEMFRGVVV